MILVAPKCARHLCTFSMIYSKLLKLHLEGIWKAFYAHNNFCGTGIVYLLFLRIDGSFGASYAIPRLNSSRSPLNGLFNLLKECMFQFVIGANNFSWALTLPSWEGKLFLFEKLVLKSLDRFLKKERSKTRRNCLGTNTSKGECSTSTSAFFPEAEDWECTSQHMARTLFYDSHVCKILDKCCRKLTLATFAKLLQHTWFFQSFHNFHYGCE